MLGIDREWLRRQGQIDRGWRLTFGDAQASQRGVYDVQDLVGPRRRLLTQAFQVIVDAADRIGEGVQALPVERSILTEELVGHKTGGTVQQLDRSIQGYHRERATHGVEDFRHFAEMAFVEVVGNVVDHRLFDLIQSSTRLLQHGGPRVADERGNLLPRPARAAAARSDSR